MSFDIDIEIAFGDLDLPQPRSSGKTPCTECPLRRLAVFENEDVEQLRFIETFKIGEMVIDQGAPIYVEGANSPYLYTLLQGWAFRYKSLADGRRQIVNYALAGDFLGLQVSMGAALECGVEALTDVRLCVFSRDRLYSLFVKHPSLGFNLTWLAAREERFLDDNLLAVGRRTALEKVAYLIFHIFVRAGELNLAREGKLDMPMTQQHFADTLGLSLVHLNKTLRKLRATGLVVIDGRSWTVKDEEALAHLAKVDVAARERRPLI
jgi:CRP/FNR family transcriptional regulator